MAKKVEVYQTEYEYLIRSHEESTLALAALQNQCDRLKQENLELRRQLGMEPKHREEKEA